MVTNIILVLEAFKRLFLYAFYDKRVTVGGKADLNPYPDSPQATEQRRIGNCPAVLSKLGIDIM